jgi:CRISPR type III-A/MTUBE-associated protein Csm6
MVTLISCVGFSDPFRNSHDGPLLHIVRSKKPDKIVLIFSAGTIKNREKIIAAISSVTENYVPTIVTDTTLIKDEDTPYFDKMFETLYGKVMQYFSSGEKIILNLSSGTPAMETALFSVNRILGLNVNAYQVKTPANDSNEYISFDSSRFIEMKNTETSAEATRNRLRRDKGEKFEQILFKESIKQFIYEYDYLSAYELINNSHFFSTNKELLDRLKQFVFAVKYQQIIPAVKLKNYNHDETKLLNSFLIFLLQVKRNMTSEIVIRGRNLTEFICELYLNRNYPGLIRYDEYNVPKLNEDDFYKVKNQLDSSNNANSRASFLSYPTYREILFILGDLNVKTTLDQLSIFDIRNQIAHNFNEIPHKRLKTLLKFYPTNNSYEIVNRLLDLMKFVFDINGQWLNFFDEENKELISLLEK